MFEIDRSRHSETDLTSEKYETKGHMNNINNKKRNQSNRKITQTLEVTKQTGKQMKEKYT